MSSFSPEQIAAVAPHVAGKIVHDLGAGNLRNSVWLANAGTTVVAIERDAAQIASGVRELDELQPGRVQVRCQDFAALRASIERGEDSVEIAFVAWPLNRHDDDLLAIVLSARLVIYAGSCCDCNACAFPDFFHHLCHRELLAYLPERGNSVIIAGELLPTRRAPTGEEYAGLRLLDGSQVFTFERAELSASLMRRSSDPASFVAESCAGLLSEIAWEPGTHLEVRLALLRVVFHLADVSESTRAISEATQTIFRDLAVGPEFIAQTTKRPDVSDFRIAANLMQAHKLAFIEKSVALSTGVDYLMRRAEGVSIESSTTSRSRESER